MGDNSREDRKTEYLFIDIEWNQAPGTTNLDGREATQIGVVAIDQQMRKVKTYYKVIKLKNTSLFNKKTEIITHTSLEDIMSSSDLKVVLEGFAQIFSEYKFIVVWNRYIYNIFIRDMKDNGIFLNKHKVIFLQEILGSAVKNNRKRIGFKRALICAEIKYVKELFHYANHDSDYLYQLFDKCFKEYVKMTGDEQCIANKYTCMMHTKDCRYLKNVSEDRKEIVPLSMLFKGYTVCKCCEKSKYWRLFEWKAGNKERVNS